MPMLTAEWNYVETNFRINNPLKKPGKPGSE